MNISSLGSGSVNFQNTTGANASRSSQANSVDQVPQDRSQLSESAKLNKQLEDLRSSDPEKYKEVTAKIASRLEEVAQKASESGNSNAANALNDLASKFKSASETGESVDLRPSGAGQSGRTRPAAPGTPPGPPPSSSTDEDSSSTDSDDTSISSTSSTTSSSTQTPSNLGLYRALQAFQQNDSFDPRTTLESIAKQELSDL